MPYNVEYIILGVPSRKQFINSMLSSLPNSTSLQIDAQPDGTIWKNAKKAWSKITNCSHILVLQDDLLIPPNFNVIVDKIINLLPNNIISLYSPRHIKYFPDSHWTTSNRVTGQALLMPTNFSRQWLRWCDKYCLPSQKKGLSDGDDIRLGAWMHATNKIAWYPSPSVVQHIGVESSVFSMHMHNKNSSSYPENPEILNTIDWSVGLENPHKSNSTVTRDDLSKIIIPEYLGQINV